MELILGLFSLLILIYGVEGQVSYDSFRRKGRGALRARLALIALISAGFVGLLMESSSPLALGDGLVGFSYPLWGAGGGLVAISWVWAFRVLVVLVGVTIIYMLDVSLTPKLAPLLIVLLVLSNLFLIRSTDLVSFYVALEMQTLCLLVLIVADKNRIVSTEAGLKYFVLGAIASGLFLFGAGLIFVSSGELGCGFISISEDSYGVLIGQYLITVALLFKVAAAPFHLWAPDVYQGACSWVAAVLSTISKLGVLAVIVIIGLNKELLLIASILSIVIGTIGALNQTRIRRLLAYSGVANMGFILLALAIGSIGSLQSGLIYIGAYIVTQVLLWSVIITISPRKDMFIGLSGYSRINPVLAVTLAITLLSIAGVPPLVGFLTKWYIVIAAVGEGYYLCAILALVFSIIAGFYYLRLVKTIYYEPLLPSLVIFKSVDSDLIVGMECGRAVLIGASLYLVLTILVSPSLFLQLTNLIVLDLFPCIS